MKIPLRLSLFLQFGIDLGVFQNAVCRMTALNSRRNNNFVLMRWMIPDFVASRRLPVQFPFGFSQ